VSERLQWAIALLALMVVVAFYWHLHSRAVNCEDRGGTYVRKWSGGYVCASNLDVDK